MFEIEYAHNYAINLILGLSNDVHWRMIHYVCGKFCLFLVLQQHHKSRTNMYIRFFFYSLQAKKLCLRNLGNCATSAVIQVLVDSYFYMRQLFMN